jgi:hypothetical protein
MVLNFCCSKKTNLKKNIFFTKTKLEKNFFYKQKIYKYFFHEGGAIIKGFNYQSISGIVLHMIFEN